MRQYKMFDVNVGGVDEMQGKKLLCIIITFIYRFLFLIFRFYFLYPCNNNSYFPGREYKVVLISTVRARQTWHMWKAFDTQHQLGFIADPKRLNTAMTRAQSLLVFVGDPYVLYRYLLIFFSVFLPLHLSSSFLDDSHNIGSDLLRILKDSMQQ